MPAQDKLAQVQKLMEAWRSGALGGERMPEDARPALLPESEELYRYLTLPMALNYQRNSYALWEAALKTWDDKDVRWVFEPARVAEAGVDDVRAALQAHKVALQPVRHTQTWMTLCRTLVDAHGGEVKRLVAMAGGSAGWVKDYMAAHKKDFPCLSGAKIGNYWLYVLDQYTDVKWVDRHRLTVAPDTHVRQASVRLGVVRADAADDPAAVADAWDALLEGSRWAPIDVHTPLWLWSRAGFPAV